MNNIINDDIIEKAVIKKVAIYKAMSVLTPPPFDDKFVQKENICQQNENIQKTNSEKCLNEIERNKESVITDTTNDIKTNSEKKSWKDITEPKERQKAYKKAWAQANKDKLKEYRRAWDEVNRESLKEKSKIYAKTHREKNKDVIKLKRKLRRQKNRYKANEYVKNRKKTDIQYKLTTNLRSRLHSAIKNNYKVGSAVKDLGCTISELKVYLESKFQPGMSWDNWGLHGWHIDHIKPLSSFDLTNREQLLEACHYTNLQPLWAVDNIIKGNR